MKFALLRTGAVLVMMVATMILIGCEDEREYIDNFRNFVVNFDLLEPYVTVRASHEGTLWATWARVKCSDKGVLLKSYDHGETWEQAYIFQNPIDTIYCDYFGNVFVATTLDRWGDPGTAELFKSADGGNTFAKVLDMLAGAPFHWNIASANGTMFVSEYGFKGHGNNARRIYRSIDFGDTWEIVFEPPPTYNWHNHKIIISGDRIYQSIGDVPHNHIIVSMDNGETWEQAIDNIHPTSAVQIGSYILWGLDSGANPGQANNGVARYNIDVGEIESFWAPPYPFYGSSYDMAIANGIVYIIFLSYGGDSHPASIWYSRDKGIVWEPLGYIAKEWYDGIGLWSLTVDDRYGYIDIQTPVVRNEYKEYFWGTLRFELLQ